MNSHEPMGELELHLPASSANLGPAFDSAAVALDLHLHVRAAAATGFSIEARGRDAELCGTVEPNLILDAWVPELSPRDMKMLPVAAIFLKASEAFFIPLILAGSAGGPRMM